MDGGNTEKLKAIPVEDTNRAEVVNAKNGEI
jgi:hypothetical protein